MKKSSLLIFYIFIFGCSNNEYIIKENNIYFSSFLVNENITGNPIELSKELFVARKFWSTDSLLFIKDSKTDDKLIHVFNLNNFKFITSIITKGRGPGELTSVGNAYIDKNLLYVNDPQIQKLLIINIDSLLDNRYVYSYISTISSSGSKITKFTKFNHKFIGELLPAHQNRFLIFDNDSSDLGSFGIFPPLKNHGNIDSLRFLVQVKGNLFQGDLQIIPEKNLFLVSHPYFDVIELFNINLKTKTLNIIGPEQNYPPKYQLLSNGTGVPCKECEFAYNSIRYFDKKIYALYSGEKFHKDGADQSKSLFIFNENGIPLKRIYFDIPLTDFILRQEGDKLKMYGLSPDSENYLYEFIIE